MISNLIKFKTYIVRNAWLGFRHHYAGKAMGIFWHIINPLLEILMYTAVFTQIFTKRGITFSDYPYVLFLCSALLPWLSVVDTINKGGLAIERNKMHLKHTATPPEVFVAIEASISGIGMLIYMVVLSLTGIFWGIYPGWHTFVMIGIGTAFVVMAFGISLTLAYIHILIPDVSEIQRALLQLWRWTLPIMYSEEIFPEKFRGLLTFNPPYYFIQSVRNAFLERQFPSLQAWGMMLFWIAIFLIAGGLVASRLRREVKDAL